MHDRFVLLKRRADLDMNEVLKLSGWIESYPELGVAYNLKETFYEIWNANDRAQAESLYDLWQSQIPLEFMGSFEPITRAMGNWHEQVFAYFDHPITNAYTESLNSLIRVMNRLGRGYSFEALRARILFIEGMQKKKKVSSSYRAKKRTISDSMEWNNVAYSMSDKGSGMSQGTRRIHTVKNYGADISTLVRMIEEEQF